MSVESDRIRNQYRTSLGREASDDEVAGWTTGKFGGGGVDQWLNQIATSHEASQRQPQQPSQPLSNQANPGAGFTPPSTNDWGSPSGGYPRGGSSPAGGFQLPSSTPMGTRTLVDGSADSTTGPSQTSQQATLPPPVTASVFQGFTPRHAMEGFMFDREQNTGKSAKDAFAYLSNQAPPPPLQDKGALGEWFKRYIEPGMNQLGHKINSVNGDSFNFSNWQGQFDVDYGRGAGAANGALAWQVQEPTARLSNGAYTPYVPPAAPTTSAPTAPVAPSNAPISSSIQYRRPAPNYNDYDGNSFTSSWDNGRI